MLESCSLSVPQFLHLSYQDTGSVHIIGSLWAMKDKLLCRLVHRRCIIHVRASVLLSSAEQRWQYLFLVVTVSIKEVVPIKWGLSGGSGVKNLPTEQEMQIWSLGQEDLLEKEMATHSSILAWRITWTEEPGGLQSMGSQRVGHDWETNQQFCWLFFFLIWIT